MTLRERFRRVLAEHGRVALDDLEQIVDELLGEIDLATRG